MSNQFERAFDALYRVQTRVLGEAIVATVGAYAVNKPAILGSVDADMVVVSGGVADAGGYEVQMKTSDFSGEPPDGTQATCNGEATGKTLQTAGPVTRCGGTWRIKLIDFASKV